jgi:hypothetical protein
MPRCADDHWHDADGEEGRQEAQADWGDRSYAGTVRPDQRAGPDLGAAAIRETAEDRGQPGSRLLSPAQRPGEGGQPGILALRPPAERW